MTSDAIGLDVDLGATVGSQNQAGGGIPHGELLIEFAEAAIRADHAAVANLRAEMMAAIGPAATGQAAATISAFSGLVRVADGTGIPIDDGLAAASTEIREALGLADYGGAANSTGAIGARPVNSINDLFDNRR